MDEVVKPLQRLPMQTTRSASTTSMLAAAAPVAPTSRTGPGALRLGHGLATCQARA